MATRLTDIVKVFSDKWTYGAVEFGYESDINKDHDRQYPALIIEPPVSVIDDVNIGRENYDFEVNFYNLYDTAAQNVVELQKRWDNLQDLANEWLDMVLKNYQDTTVQAYIDEAGINIERVKEVGNDRLVQLKVSFTINGFTKCFRPISKYPSDIADLAIWLKADSGATFDIATKSLSKLTDQTPSSISFVSQPTKSKQPLRYGYDGANDKTYLNFDGTNDLLISDRVSPLGADFTLFEVSKGDSVNSTIFGYDRGSSQVSVKISGSGSFSAFLFDGVKAMNVDSGRDNLGKNHIGIIKKSNQTVDLEYYDSVDTLSDTDTNASYNGTLEYNQRVFTIGASVNTSDVGSLFLNGNIQEVIVYNKVLTDNEISDVKSYLNTKYRIY